MAVAPGAIAFEIAGKAPQPCPEDGTANVDRVTREREPGTEIGLDLRVRPPSDVILEPAFASEGKVVEPAGEI